jgi:hypothetical protein
MKLVGHVVRTAKIRNRCKRVVGGPLGNAWLAELVTDETTILKLIIRNKGEDANWSHLAYDKGKWREQVDTIRK